MGFDILSPVASAQIHVLVLPADNVKREKFASFVERLREVHEARLGDLSPSAGSESFSPLGFPSGRLLFRFSTSERPAAAVHSFPFELNREPQVVLVLADGNTLLHDSDTKNNGNASRDFVESPIFQDLLGRLEDCKLRYRRAVVHQLLVFDLTYQAQEVQHVMFIPKPKAPQVPTMKTVVCGIGVLFLNGMRNLANALQELPMIESPSLIMSAEMRNGTHHLADKERHRMSMPSSPSAETTTGRFPNSLSQNGSTPPISNPNSELPSRDQSRDRYSTMELASSAPSMPRLAVRKGRTLVVKGAIYLQAGRWPDALKTLSEGIAVSQTNIDYVWHARGLEYILVCMLMFVWAKMPFEIPNVCLSSAEQRTKTEALFYTPDTSGGDSIPPARLLDQPLVSTQVLISLFPDVVRTILTMYTRAIAFTAEKLPQILLCEAKLRLVGLLLVVSLSKVTLDWHSLDRLLCESSLGRSDRVMGVSSNVGVRKEELIKLLLEAIPSQTDNISLSDSLEILIGIASLLSCLNLGRKQAFFLKEVLSTIIPGLVEARKIGAAEMGVHPSAGLSMLQGTSTGGSSRLKHRIKPLLRLIGDMYDVPYIQGKSSAELHRGTHSTGDKLRIWADARNHGDPALKVEILRYCISICETLPDLEGILGFAVQLLHTARNVITLPPTHLLGPPSLSQEEQTRLFNTVKRTVGAAARLGQENILADYWDDFLIRGVEPLSPSERCRFTVHSLRELAAVVPPSPTTKRDPFIYSSFAKPKARSDTNAVLTAGEMVYFAVLLQNPFEFDVEIDRISLIGEGCGFVASDHSIVLGQYCSQNIVMFGKPTSAGTLKITGCSARVRYCHERAFHIFSKQWSPEPYIKLKPQRSTSNRPSSCDSERPDKLMSTTKEPMPETVSLTVLNPQPVLSVTSLTLFQPAVMLLEGETKSFRVTLHNTSNTASADFLLFTFQDSATTQLQDAIARRELSPTELYELQLQLAGTPSLKWVSEDNDSSTPKIAAGSSSTFEFEVFGKPGLLSGVIQVDYAHMGISRSEMREKFYTRQLRYPLSLTVNGAIEISRCNILPFTGDFAWSNQQRVDDGFPLTTSNSQKASPKNRSKSATATTRLRDDDQLMPLLSRLGLGSHGSDHCLLLLDLRNVWPNPLSISIQVRESSTETMSPTDPWRRAYTVHELLQPSHISRVVLLLPRVFIREPQAPIPLIGNQRQFVISASKLSAESEAANRELFWYREEVLKYIKGTWRDESTGRVGEINMRKGVRLSPRMIDAIKVNEIEIDFSIRALEKPSHAGSGASFKAHVMQIGHAHFVLQTNMFTMLTAKIHNHSSDRLQLLLRLQPSLRNQPHNIALDLSKRFAWTGMLQRALHPPLEPGEVREAELGIIALCEGDFEVGVTIEEIRPNMKQLTESGNLAVGASERRIWHAREPCLIDAVDNKDP